MKKLCLECRASFTGRSDKKFCSDYCRNSYNNKRNSAVNNFVRNINAILRKNRRILEAMYTPAGEAIDRIKLKLAGYNFDYFTNYNRSGTDGRCCGCYEYAIRFLKNNKVKIINLESDNPAGPLP